MTIPILDSITPSPLGPGIILPFGGPGPRLSTPIWALLCDTTAYSRTTYSNLFGVIGTAYGVGDGSTTFNVPNMVGRVPAGAGGSGITGVGATGGEQTHALTKAEVPKHTHGPGSYVINTWWPTNIISNAYQDYVAFAGLYATDRFGVIDGTVSGTSEDGTITGLGTGSPTHNNMQPYVGTNFIITI